MRRLQSLFLRLKDCFVNEERGECDHVECDRPPFTGKWLPKEKKWAKVLTKYLRLNCSLCGKKNARKYCKLQ